jgi:uncharacterized membrane protein YcaP (DUF421 family)
MQFAQLIEVNTPALELIVRGSVMYWFLLLVFRFVLRRDPGALGVADLLFIVIVADASQNAMAGGYDTVAEGLILVGTLVFWNYAIDWASYRWAPFRWLTEPPPLVLIEEGKLVRKNLRKEFLTRETLEAELREAGVDDIANVRRALMESDGKFSVLTYESTSARKSSGPPGAGGD